MSYSDSDLRDEISAQIVTALEIGDTIVSDWIALAVIRKHMPEFNKASDFVTNAVWGRVRKMVGAEARRFKYEAETENEDQGVLPGFELLQQYYECVREDGNTVRAVRVHRMKMTTSERRAQAEALIKNGQTLIEHGRQLNRETDELIAAGLLPPDEE